MYSYLWKFEEIVLTKLLPLCQYSRHHLIGLQKVTSSKKVSKVKELNFFSIANKVHAVDSIKVMSIVVY